MIAPRLRVAGLAKAFGGVRAVTGVSFEVASAEAVGLVGPNGAGKSTIVDLITGAQAADSGETRIDGVLLKGAPSTRARVGGLARTFQHPRLALELTVRENLHLGTVAHLLVTVPAMIRTLIAGAVGFDAISDEERRAVEVCAESLGVKELDRVVADLTLGEMRLVEVARALLQSPKVMLLDEPFAGSDANGVGNILSAIDSVTRSGCAVILIDHNVDLVAQCCSRLVLLNFGRVSFDGPTDECLKSPEMHDIYFGEVEPGPDGAQAN